MPIDSSGAERRPAAAAARPTASRSATERRARRLRVARRAGRPSSGRGRRALGRASELGERRRRASSGVEAGLGRVDVDVDLEQDRAAARPGRTSRARAGRAARARSTESTDWIDVEQLERPARLVRLERPDEVPAGARRPSGALAARLLDPVLAERRRGRPRRPPRRRARPATVLETATSVTPAGVAPGAPRTRAAIRVEDARRGRPRTRATSTGRTSGIAGRRRAAGAASLRGGGSSGSRGRRRRRSVARFGGPGSPTERSTRGPATGGRGVVVGRGRSTEPSVDLGALALELLEEVALARRRGAGRRRVHDAGRLARGASWRLRPPSKPVAMTVIMTSSPRRSLKLVPKMMFASGSAAARISSAASVTSNRARFDEPVMLNRMPWAPVMLTSSSGLAMAWRAASTARFSPVARPMPMSAEPASFMIVRTSAKSRLMSPGTVMMSLMPWTPWRSTSSTTRKASRIDGVLLDDVPEPVVGDRDERVDLGLELLGRLLGDELALGALEAERLGHDADRQRAAAPWRSRRRPGPRPSRCRRRGRR